MDTRTRRRQTPALTIGELVTAYLFHAENTLAAVTYTGYRDTLRLFIAAVGPETPADDVTDLAIVRWQKARLDQGRSPNTVRSDNRRLRAFYSWAFDRGHVSRHWAKLATPPAEPDVIGHATTLEELGLMLKKCMPPTLYRDRAILLLLWDTGMRIGELSKLLLANVDVGDPMKPKKDDDWQPTVHLPAAITKTNQERWCPFSLETRLALTDYLAFERGSMPGALFISSRRGQGAFHEQTAKHIVRKLAQLAKVDVSAHDFRRAFVGRLQAADIPVPDTLVQELGGWRSPEMVRRYGRDTAKKNALAAYKKALG